MSTYEQLRDEATGDGANAWREADREERRLRVTYESLKNDPKYAEEYRAEQAWAAYEAAQGKIVTAKARARELLQKQFWTNEKSSFPLPDAEVLVTTDTQKLLASQNEAARVVRKLERMTANTKGPFARDKSEVLREEYGRGLEAGGVTGGAICRGVLEAAEEMGVDAHSIVDGFERTVTARPWSVPNTTRGYRTLSEARPRSRRLRGRVAGGGGAPFTRAGRRPSSWRGQSRPKGPAARVGGRRGSNAGLLAQPSCPVLRGRPGRPGVV